jgi:hypothetical protein
MTSVTLNEAREAIYQRWVDNAPAGIGTNFAFANEKFKAPTDAPWARVTVLHEQGEQDSLGPIASAKRKFLRRGRVLIQIYDSVDQGTRALDLLADEARDIFEGTQFSGLYFISADIRESGQDGEWMQLIVDAPFDYQETK